MGDFADYYGGYDYYDDQEIYERRKQSDKDRKAQRAKLLTPVNKVEKMGILTRKEFQDDMAKAWSEAVESTYRDLIDAAVLAEREACAKVVDAIEARCVAKDVDDPPLAHVSAAIRARGQT